MLAGVRVIAAALAMVSVSFAAVAQAIPPGAQIVPPSDQPGRERERFERPAVPLAQPGGAAIAVPGIEAPPGAAETTLVIRQIRVTGAHRLHRRPARRALRRPDRAQGLAAGGLRSRPAHHRQVRRRRLRALARDRAGAGARSQRRRRPHPGGGRLHRHGRVAGAARRAIRDFFTYYAAQDHRRAAGQYPHHRALPAARRRPAGPEIQEQPQAASDQGGRRHPGGRGHAEKPLDLFGRVDNRGTQARGPLQYLGQLHRQQLAAACTSARSPPPAPSRPASCSTMRNYRQVLTSEGLTFFANASYGFGPPGTRDRTAVPELQDQQPLSRGRAELSDHPRARTQSQRQRPDLRQRRQRLVLRHAGRAAEHARPPARLPPARPKPTSPIQLAGSTSSTSSSARASRASAAPRTATTSPRARQRPGRFHQDGADAVAAAAAVRPVLGAGRRLWAIRLDPAAGVGAVRLWRACVRPRLRPFAVRLRHLHRGPGRVALRYSPQSCKGLTQAQLYGFIDHGWLHNLAPVPGTFANVDAASGSWAAAGMAECNNR